MSIRRQVLLPVLVLIPVGIGVGLGWARGGGDGAWDLALEPGESWTLERTDAPVLAAALSARKVAVVPPDRSRVILLGREDRDEVAGFGASEISALAADPEGVWIAAGRSVYRVGEEDLEVREWHGFDGAGEILAMAHARGRLWVVHGELGLAWLSALDLGGETDPQPVGRIELASPHVSLHGLAGGGVLVQDRMPPFELSKVDGDLSEAWAIVEQGDAIEELGSDPGSWVLGAPADPEGREVTVFRVELAAEG